MTSLFIRAEACWARINSEVIKVHSVILKHKKVSSFFEYLDSLKLLVGSIESLITEYCLGTISVREINITHVTSWASTHLFSVTARF